MLQWAMKMKPFAKVGLALAWIALKVYTGLAIPELNSHATLGTKAGGASSTFVEDLLDSGGKALASVAWERMEGDRPEELLQHAGARETRHNT